MAISGEISCPDPDVEYTNISMFPLAVVPLKATEVMVKAGKDAWGNHTSVKFSDNITNVINAALEAGAATSILITKTPTKKYSYEEYKLSLFTERGQTLFLEIKNNVKELLKTAGAVRMDSAIGGIFSGAPEDFEKFACVDRLVELKEISELATPEGPTNQYERIFIRKRGNNNG